MQLHKFIYRLDINFVFVFLIRSDINFVELIKLKKNDLVDIYIVGHIIRLNNSEYIWEGSKNAKEPTVQNRVRIIRRNCKVGVERGTRAPVIETRSGAVCSIQRSRGIQE